LVLKNIPVFSGGVSRGYDYLLMGRRADKNELYFLERLNEIAEKRSVLWVGGVTHKDKVKTHHNIDYTGFCGVDLVRALIPSAKVGIICSEHPSEGFPQSFLEMTMCGTPVAYLGPVNNSYIGKHNCRVMNKREDVVDASEWLLKNADEDKCRKEAVERYSLERSYRHLCEL
jgi:hypothetical protein